MRASGHGAGALVTYWPVTSALVALLLHGVTALIDFPSLSANMAQIISDKKK